MPNVESTAVNELVDLAQQTPLGDIDDDLFGAPKTRRGLFELPPAPPAPAPAASAPTPRPIAPTPRPIAPMPLYLDEPVTASRPRARRGAWRRLALPAAAVLAVATGGGLLVAHLARGGSAAPSTAQATPLAQSKPIVVEPAAPPPVLVPTTAPAPKLVDVRLESTPPGASATLLADGAATPLGATPVVASVDPTRHYDVVFALEGQPSQVIHLEPSTTHELQVAFAAPPLPAPPLPAPPATPAPATSAPATPEAPAHVAAAAPVEPAPPATSSANKHIAGKHIAAGKRVASAKHVAKARHHHHASRVASAKRTTAPALADPAF